MAWKREINEFKRGEGLIPLEPVDLEKINSFSQLLEAMAKTAFSGRQLGRAYHILYEAFTDPKTLVVMTLSGALTVAKQGKIIIDLVERGCVDILISTGALLTHGLVEGMGIHHYQCRDVDDSEAFKMGYNRIYDTIELENSLLDLEEILGEHLHELIPAMDGKTAPSGSADFCRRFGLLMKKLFPDGKNILSAAAAKGVPVYIPAFTDCEMGLDLAAKYIERVTDLETMSFDQAPILPFNPFADLLDYTKRIARHEGRLGIFTLGGGVPRNWAQQVSPFLDIMEQEGFPTKKLLFSRGVRICPEPVHWGGLSGCTYEEGVSWGKFLPKSEGGKYAEVTVDATAVLPLLIKAIFERMDKEV